MIVFVQDFFTEHYKGGAELTTEAIIEQSLFPVNKVMCQAVTIELMDRYKSSLWIFGNYSQLSKECMLYAAKNLKYVTIEYDYKYCKYRSPEKHVLAEESCLCKDTQHGKLVSIFINNSQSSFWMSKMQLDKHVDNFSFLEKSDNVVLSSIFSEETLEYILSLDTSNKSDKWLILNSPSWIKGVEDCVKYAKDNNLDYELVWDLEYKELLLKLASSKGVVFLPRGGDTCPRWIVEAKMLNCQLVINDNVQHKSEEWFRTKESTVEYMKDRADYFWSHVENKFSDILNLPKAKFENGDIKFHVIVPFYNASKWIGKCAKSIRKQVYENYNCVFVDDMSTDNSIGEIKKVFGDDNRCKIIKNKQKKYALSNIVNAISSQNMSDNDIIVLLDGDDWLSSTKTLSKLFEVYKDKEVFMTYGSYVFNPTGTRGPEPSEYSKQVIEQNLFREDQWRASHLRSFRKKIWNKIHLKDLKGEDGKYYPMAYDQAIMLPLLELSAERSRYVSDSLYVYNKENPLNVDKIKAEMQKQLALNIRSKTKYKRL